MNKGANIIAVAAAGFIAGMLLAPKSGKETRQDLKTKALDAKKAARIKAEDLKHAMKAGVNTFHHSAKDAGEEISDLAESAKYKADRIAEDARTNFNEDMSINTDKQGK
ncbi:MAG: YtxH domain-containing protein [Candidatus Saccharimonadales bacterium]